MILGVESGFHNQDLEMSGRRIQEGGSWKQQRVVMVIPAGKMIPVKVYLSHCSLIFPPNQMCYKMATIGIEVGEAFSKTIEEVLKHPQMKDWEYLLTIEHDNIPPVDGLLKLLERMEKNKEFAAICGLYWTKGEGGVPQIWGDPKDPVLNFRPQQPKDNELVECNGLGMGFTLFRLSMFRDKKLRKPWFKTMASKEGVGTQDLYFWQDAKKRGYRCAVDCAVKVGHYDSERDITW